MANSYTAPDGNVHLFPKHNKEYQQPNNITDKNIGKNSRDALPDNSELIRLIEGRD